jgi:hypothetical protein
MASGRVTRFEVECIPPPAAWGGGRCASLSTTMASPQTQTTPQRLAAIREQMSLLSDYL